MSLPPGKAIEQVQRTHTRSMQISVDRTQGKTITELPPIIDGTLNLVRQGIRRRLSITFETQVPSTEFLQTLDDDNAIWSIALGAAGFTREQGKFFLRDYSIDNTGQNKNYRLYLQDESAVIAERKTTYPERFTGDVADVCRKLLLGSGRDLKFSGISQVGTNIDVVIDADRDRWAEAALLLLEYGYDLLMDNQGQVWIRPFPEKSNINTDISSLILSEQETEIRRSVNHIIVTSETFRADVVDNDPSSPSYFYGPYGDVPMFVSSRGLTSNEACREVGERIAAKEFGRRTSTVFACLQLPLFDLGNTIVANKKSYLVTQASYALVPFRPMYLTSHS